MGKNKIIIAIDGHSSTGKSTFARAIAKALNYTYVDSGAMYRAVCLFALRHRFIDDQGNIDAAALQAQLPQLQIQFKINSEGQNECFLNGENVERQIRSLDVSQNVSAISTLSAVRAFVDSRLTQFGYEKGVVMDGRDIGTAVFPQAELKLFMTAKASVRALRRLKEMQAKGEQGSYEEVLANIESRDYTDSHRQVNPLRQADDAILLDNSEMTMEQQMLWLEKILKEKWPFLLK